MSSKFPAALAAAAALLAVPAAAGAQVPSQCDTAGPVGLAYTTGVNCRTLDLDGVQRRYEVYLPANVQPHPPVVFMFHGSSGTGEQFLAHSGWREEADRSGIVAVFPTGQRYRITETGRLSTKWADFNLSDDTTDAPADDVGFVDDMLADLEARLPVDTHRIYASGFSNGAGFAARLAVDRSEIFAAVAFSGGGLDEVHTSSRPVPTYSTVGTLDDRVLAQTDPPLTELPLDPVGILTNPRLHTYLSNALQTLGLDQSLYSVLAGPHTTSFRWPGTDPLMRFTMIEGLTHRYPDDAAREFGAFFEQHRLP
jgi:poly(3-hydroxybutyrate) depolymerase